jgi:anti-anti-sigma factor
MRAASSRHPVLVVDMTGTHFCDSSALHALVAAHQRARADGGELRLVISAGGAVPRVLALTGVDRVIPCFPSVKESLAKAPYGTSPQLVPPEPGTDQSQA